MLPPPTPSEKGDFFRGGVDFSRSAGERRSVTPKICKNNVGGGGGLCFQVLES